jgi:cardiolipin synthase A/B
MVSMPAFTYFTKPQYFADVIERLARAKRGERVITMAMVIEPRHPDIAPLLDALCAAARRGADVTVIIDAYGLMLEDPKLPGPLFFHSELPDIRFAKPFQERVEALADLEAAGARTAIINQPGRPLTNPKAGRCHIKLSVIGDYYYLGGCNLENYGRVDTMVGAHDPDTADWLAGLAEDIFDAGSIRKAFPGADITRSVGLTTSFFVDTGVRHRSVILRQALDLIDAASEHITYTGQYFPLGITADHLLQAQRRGVRVTIIYNHPSLSRWPLTWIQQGVVANERRRMPAEFFSRVHRGPGYLHAKLIATEQGAMIGSHNFVQAGVSFGTAEIAMLVRDPEFARRATESVLQQLR